MGLKLTPFRFFGFEIEPFDDFQMLSHNCSLFVNTFLIPIRCHRCRRHHCHENSILYSNLKFCGKMSLKVRDLIGNKSFLIIYVANGVW